VILLVNGPNLNLLGEREPHLYGTTTLAEIESSVRETCAAYGVEVKAFQSNCEGALIDFLQANRREAQGVIANLGALTHTSYALHDCFRSLPCPALEVHLSNTQAREEWRHRSVVAPATRGQIAGLGPHGYRFAAEWLCLQIPGVADGKEPGEAAPAPRRTTAARGEYE
jgi:3-dehydroquinate dehydratase II